MFCIEQLMPLENRELIALIKNICTISAPRQSCQLVLPKCRSRLYPLFSLLNWLQQIYDYYDFGDSNLVAIQD